MKIHQKNKDVLLGNQKMQDKWPSYIAHDPFYNDNLTKEGIGDFSLRPD